MKAKMPPGPWKMRLARIALALFGVALGVLAAEIAARWISPNTGHWGDVSIPSGLHVMDRDRLPVPRPGFKGEVILPGHSSSISINSLGLRGPEPPRPLPSGGWLTVGDSFTFAGQVDHEHTFQARLARGTGLPFWNAGVDAYSTREATARYRKLANVLPVEGVLLVFYLGNDLLDNEVPAHSGPPTKAPPPPPRGTRGAPALERLLVRHSFLYAHFSSWWNFTRMLTTGAELNMWREELLQFSGEGAGRLQRRLPSTEAALAELERETASRGHRLLVAMAPQAIQVVSQRMEATFEFAKIDPAKADLDAPNRALQQILHRLKIPSCDLLPGLRAAARGGARVHFTYDIHWTEAGHRVVARALARCLEQL